MLHWPGSHPLEDTFAAFEQLQAQGKIRAYGVSNFDEDELEAAVKVAGPGRIACNQVLYHLAERHIEQAVLPACERHGVSLVAYSPFGSGDFDDKAPALLDVANRHRATPRQVALAFLTRRETVFTIPKAATVEHALENAAADRLKLSENDFAVLDASFPMRVRSHLPVI
jgi:diketogulonate reductase-like aldo/keto reductase